MAGCQSRRSFNLLSIMFQCLRTVFCATENECNSAFPGRPTRPSADSSVLPEEGRRTKKEEVCFGPPAFAGNYRHLPAIAGFCRRLPAYAGICRKVPEKSRRTIKMSLSGRLSPSPGLTPTSGLTPFGRRERTGLLSAYSVVRFPPSFGNIFYPFTNYDF